MNHSHALCVSPPSHVGTHFKHFDALIGVIAKELKIHLIIILISNYVISLSILHVPDHGRGPQKVDKCMVLEHTHGLFIT